MLISDLLEWLTSELDAERLEALEMDWWLEDPD